MTQNWQLSQKQRDAIKALFPWAYSISFTADTAIVKKNGIVATINFATNHVSLDYGVPSKNGNTYRDIRNLLAKGDYDMAEKLARSIDEKIHPMNYYVQKCIQHSFACYREKFLYDTFIPTIKLLEK